MDKIAIVGTGHRCYNCFGSALAKDFTDNVKLVGIYDINPKRAKAFCELLKTDLPIFEDFDEMLDTAKPDTVLVTCIDRFHHEYIARAMAKGCDVITEKPMTTDVEKAKVIFAAQKKYGKRLTVTFNCRFMPYFVKLKEIIASGVLGKIHTVNYQYNLDRIHGADYYRRWHRKMENSGGLLVHKSTHHFDILNWLLDDQPLSVSSKCALSFFGKNGPFHGEKCRTCAHAKECEFYWDVNEGEFYKYLYCAAEDVDGYYRDSCVFSPDIDIYDQMSVNINYSKGTIATYTLTAFNTFEGYNLSIVGDKARLDSGEIVSGLDTGKVNKITITENLTNKVIHEFSKTNGLHGGGDERMRNMLFSGKSMEDPLNQLASAEDGLISLLVGVCANVSAETGKSVDIQDAFHKICR